MVVSGFFNAGDGIAVFRCIDKFVAQFGIHGDPKVCVYARPTHLIPFYSRKRRGGGRE